MKNTVLTTSAALFMSVTNVFAQTPDKALSNYFQNYVLGEEHSIIAEHPITDVEHIQKVAWEAWKEANAKVTTFSDKQLNDASVAQYNIPAELEPDAIMNYYYGTKGQRPAAGYPFFLYLHGSGPKAQEWATGLKLATMLFKDDPSVYMIPQIPNEGQLYRWWQKGKQWVWNKLLTRVMLDENINPNQIYFFGISEGGYGSQRLGSFFADYLAAVGPMAGGEPLRNAPVENMMNTPFSLLTGEFDRMFSRDILTRRALKAFTNLQAKHPGKFIHRIELPEGRAHSIDYSPTTPWLRQFVRNATPNEFQWENFEMDGIKRNAFYNLVVGKENTIGDQRTFYTYKACKNEIHITVEHVTYETTMKDPMGIEVSYNKNKTKAEHGEIYVMLNQHMFNPKKKVKIFINGQLIVQDKLKPTYQAIARSITTFSDPERIFPYEVKLSW